MKFIFPALFIALILAACTGNNAADSLSKPYRFDRESLDKMVKEKKAIYDISKRPDGTLSWEKYYLGDSVKYELSFDDKSNLKMVVKYDEHGQPVWEDKYHPNGQRKAHYTLKTLNENGRFNSVYDGYFEQYYENGNVMERGVYKNQDQLWTQKITREGYAGDTTFYEYAK